jgi:hypothetical protein
METMADPSSPQSDDRTMRDFEIALMDAIRTICEVLVAKQIVPAEVLAEMFRQQRDRYPREQMPGAVFVMNMILEPLTNPERTATRKLEREPPQGQA